MRSFFAVTLLVLTLGILSCSKKDAAGGGGSSAQFTFKGKVANTRTRAGTITDVMAVSAESASSNRYISAVAADGSFTIPVNTDRPYLLVFIDRTKVGAAMIIARVTASSLGLHTLPVSGTGTLDTGTMTVASGMADVAISGNVLTAALGITAAAATSVAALDGVVLRYTNPDIDGDGIPDVTQNRDYRLDFHVRYDMKVAGVNSTINDLFADFLPTTVKETYSSNGIYVSYPKSVISATTGTVTFLGDGTAGSGDVTTSEAGTILTGNPISTLTVNGYGDYLGFGPNLTSTSHVPVGEYDFAAGSSVLKFTSVTPSNQATLSNPNGDILPFIHFVKTDSTCTSACTVASIGYKWMIYDGTAWAPVTDLATLKMRVSDSGGFVSIRRGGDATKGIGATIPTTSLNGTIAWTMSALNVSGVTAAELAATTSAQICHLGLSYDDKLGLRHFENIAGNGGISSECGT